MRRRKIIVMGDQRPVPHSRLVGEPNNQEAVPARTQLFRDIFSTSPIGIVVENLDGQPLFANPAFCLMLGFTEAELQNMHCVQFSPPEDAEKDWALFQRLRAGSIEYYQLEKRYFKRDGSLMWGHLTISLLKQSPPLVVAMVEDITEKKAAEELWSRQTAIIESSEDAIIFKNMDGVIVSWNSGAQRMFGYTEAEALGQRTTILIPSDSREEDDQIFTRVKAEGRVEHYETIGLTKSGKRIHVSLIIFPLKHIDGRILGFISVVHDITERKLAEEALRAANRVLEKQTAELQAREDLLKIFVKTVPAGVAMLDREMRYLQVSDRFCEDYSLVDISHVLGRSHYEIFPDIPERWKEIHRRALAGEAIRSDEDRWDRKSGTAWVKWEIRPWFDADGVPGGILIFAEDITRSKQMEQALSDMARKLIESQERERTRIARELHDDINQRLALLAVEMERLEENPSESPKRLREFRELTIEISQDVQALSHELHSSKLEYLGAVAAMRSWCREYAEQQKLQINFNGGTSKFLPFEVGLCLFRVLQEALHNSVKHSGAKQIDVQLTDHANEVELTVTDLGAGFDMESAKACRGVGLVSMQERVRLVHGTIEIQSKPTAGTIVRIRLPVEPRKAFQRGAT